MGKIIFPTPSILQLLVDLCVELRLPRLQPPTVHIRQQSVDYFFQFISYNGSHVGETLSVQPLTLLVETIAKQTSLFSASYILPEVSSIMHPETQMQKLYSTFIHWNWNPNSANWQLFFSVMVWFLQCEIS